MSTPKSGEGPRVMFHDHTNYDGCCDEVHALRSRVKELEEALSDLLSATDMIPHLQFPFIKAMDEARAALQPKEEK